MQSSRCTIPIYVHCTRCSRVSQGHAILLIQGTWHGAQCMQQGIIGACRVISWLSWGRRCHTHQHPSNQFAMFLWLYNIFDTFLHILKMAVTFFRQHICTKAQGKLHKTFCEKAQRDDPCYSYLDFRPDICHFFLHKCTFGLKFSPREI